MNCTQAAAVLSSQTTLSVEVMQIKLVHEASWRFLETSSIRKLCHKMTVLYRPEKKYIKIELDEARTHMPLDAPLFAGRNSLKAVDAC